MAIYPKLVLKEIKYQHLTPISIQSFLNKSLIFLKINITFVNIVNPLSKPFCRNIGGITLENITLFFGVVDVDINVDGVRLLGDLSHDILTLVVALNIPSHGRNMAGEFSVHPHSKVI